MCFNEQMSNPKASFCYKIESWDMQMRFCELLAAAQTYDIAHALFVASMREKPKDHILLRRKTKVIMDSETVRRILPESSPIKRQWERIP